MTEQQRYYEYEGDEPNESWDKKEPPVRSTDFERKLKDLGGVNDRGEPVLRVVWGGTCLDDRSEEVGRLKYSRRRQVRNGSHYYDGTLKGYRYVKDLKDVPKDKLAVASFEIRQYGKLRWIVERYVSPAFLEMSHRFAPNARLDPATGEKLLRDFPRAGIYDHYFTIETRDHHFRDLDNEVFDTIAGMWRYNTQVSMAQQEKDDEARHAAEKTAEDASVKEIWSSDALKEDIELYVENKIKEREHALEAIKRLESPRITVAVK